MESGPPDDPAQSSLATATVVPATDTQDVKHHDPRPTKVPALKQHATPRTRLLGVVAVLLLALLCLGWTIWLMILSASPTATINRLMDTETLDFGSFWRLSEFPRAIVGVGVAGLAGVALGDIVVLMRVWTHAMPYKTHAKPTSAPRCTAKVFLVATQTQSRTSTTAHDSRTWSNHVGHHARRFASDVLDRESKTRRTIHSLIKVADLVIQCVYLVQLLEEGMPLPLIGVFAATVALNALTAAVMFLLPYDNMGGAQLLVDTAFDFVVALAFPVLVLIYALASFTFDQSLMAINAETFPLGFFERVAAVVANPMEVTIVRRTLDSLRIDSVVKIFTRVGTSATLCRRFFGLAKLLRAQKAGLTAYPNVYPKRHRAFAAFFFAVATAVVAFTAGSVLTSSAACAMHPECVQIARRWIVGRAVNDATRCPCLAVIDANVAIATFDEWTKPIDRTQKLAQLAASGDLQTIQLVNRALPQLPVELRRCKGLKHVSLYYTETTTLPDWFAEFTQLEFFHVEGKSPFQAFQRLPDKVFDNMHELAYLHLAVQGLQYLPSLDGLVNLKTLTLAAIPFLIDLPSFDKLHKLERLTVAGAQIVHEFPDLTNVRGLKSLIVADRGEFCCNGFLGDDKCDLSRSLCQQHLFGAPAVTQCLSTDRQATPATRAYFDKFPFSACYGEAIRPGEFKLAPTPDEMAQCNGTMYRACVVSNGNATTPGMCYNTRWMAIACDASPFPVAMRRLQIARGRGQRCDPKEEAWLGCS